MRKYKPSVSVVLCCYNGADVLAGALSALKAQDYAGKLEIIVVDDGSSDDTVAVARGFAGVRVVCNAQNMGLAASRNVGIQEAAGEIIAFTDDDCRPAANWLTELVAGYRNGTVQGVGGAVSSADRRTAVLRYLHESKPLKPLESTLLASRKLSYRFRLYLRGLMGKTAVAVPDRRAVYSLVGANMSFRKSALAAVGGFDDRFRFGGEEEDLCKRLNERYSEGLLFIAQANVAHEFEPSLRDTLRRARAYGRGNARMYHKHADVTPVIFPFPPAIAALLALGFVHPLLAAVPFLAVPLVYARWAKMAIRKRSLEPLAYAFIQYAQEWAGNIGFVQGWWQYRHMFDGGRPLPAAGFIAGGWASRARTWVPAVLLLLGLLAIKPFGLTWLHMPLAVALLAVPGYLLLRIIGPLTSRLVERFALAAVAGMVWLFVIGLAATAVLPVFGVERPLDTVPLLGVYGAGLAGLTLLALRRPQVASRPAPPANRISLVLYGVAIMLPMMSFIGAALLNNGKANALLIAMFLLAVAAIITAIVRSSDVRPSVFPALLYSVSLSAVWTYALRSGYVYGWDIQEEFSVFQATHAAGIWHAGGVHGAYDAMLSLTVFPSAVSNLTGLSGAVIFKVFFPMLFSLLPVVLYYAYRMFARHWVAFAAAMLTVAQFYYLQEFAALARQQIAFLFFAVFMYALVDKSWAPATRRWFLGMGAFGLIVSHYSTTYATVTLLAGLYIAAKVVQLAIRQDLSVGRILRREAFLHWWLVPAFIIGMAIWYGPVTHFNKVADSIFKPSAYAAFADKTAAYLQRDVVFAVTSDRPEATTGNYLTTIGEEYRTEKPYLDYYPLASNAGLEEKKSPVIPAAPVLHPLSLAVDAVLRFGWWFLAMGGSAVLVWRAWWARGTQQVELALLVAAAPVMFILAHLVPQVASLYNVSRMSEHMLLIGALPAVALAAWLLGRFAPAWHKLVIGGALGLSLLFAGGIVTQMVGGTPTANLNNFGSDYQRFYTTETDKAAAAWLGDRRDPEDIVFADRYAALRLTAETNVKHNFFRDVTPETLDMNAFVFAGRTNVADGTSMASYQGKTVQFAFPDAFLDNTKDLLYTNGKAEIYR